MQGTALAGRASLTAVAAALLVLMVQTASVSDPVQIGTPTTTPPAARPGTVTLHEASNTNFDAALGFGPGALGFNLAEVATTAELDALPSGVKALIWVGRCDGVTPAFENAVQPYLDSPKVFGYYLMDEPDPNGRWKPECPAGNLAAESDYLHQHSPGRHTFFLMMDLGMAAAPSYVNRGDFYSPSNTHIDLVGIDPYPCRAELHGCDLNQISTFLQAAQAVGWPLSSVVPVYQAFGGGGWRDDEGAPWLLPTPDQAAQMMAVWRQFVPDPVFDQAYSWGTQKNDTTLVNAPAALRAVFAQHNASGTAQPAPSLVAGAAGAQGVRSVLPSTTAAVRSSSPRSVRRRRSAR
ncbi:hypothetical protein [Streptacidiphilus jiangxiensis]|uniref:Calcium-binding protein n=1 Tax=Streptacidiphilus jiangxiensis TaxID=235985 RepID=A0A1H7QPF3_STRJI|nr:hypothetical protein [Streptacidiphilus jiangxiensis]SEL49793.1 hypothetical protein SAMN05414137_109142 [Streptacidiphilus jiangxiensis]